MRSMKFAMAASAVLFAGTASAQTELSLWYHGAGNETEAAILNSIIDDFNASQSDYAVAIESFPQESYNDSIIAAAVSGSLPDIIDVDGPIMPNWAWAGYMQPLQLSEGAVDKFLPGALGYHNGELYSVGLWDAAVAVFARKSVLEGAGIRIPTLDAPWSKDEFSGAIDALAATGDFDYPFDLGMAWGGEWYCYAFCPLLESFGGELIDSSAMFQTAEGALNGDAAVDFGNYFQDLFSKGMIPGTNQDGADRDRGFLDGKYAMQWNGNWAALPALEAFGDDMLFLPAPDFGNGNKIGSASWQFGVSASSENVEGASAFIEFAMQDKYLADFTAGIGLIPATAEAAALTENYAPGGAMEIFFDLSNEQGVLRSPTPAYLVATGEFEKAFRAIADGGDVQAALDEAVDAIDSDIEANSGYGMK